MKEITKNDERESNLDRRHRYSQRFSDCVSASGLVSVSVRAFAGGRIEIHNHSSMQFG
jgi:hypothetical protein